MAEEENAEVAQLAAAIVDLEDLGLESASFEAEDESEEQRDDPDGMPPRPDLTDQEIEQLANAVQFEWPDPEDASNWAAMGPHFPWDNRTNTVIFCQLVKRGGPIPTH